MEFLGHTTSRAALIYQHVAAERAHRIAEGLDEQAADVPASSGGAARRSRLPNGHGRATVSAERGTVVTFPLVETMGFEPTTPCLQRIPALTPC